MTTTGNTQVLTGADILKLSAYLQNLANTDQRAYATLSGYLNGSPTLQRDMWQGTRQDAERQYAIDVAQLGLQQANLNFQQRVAEADTKISEMGLLASQRGPENAIAYNYLLNNGVAPSGTAVGGSSISTGINQPYAATAGGLGGAIVMPNQQGDAMARANAMSAAWNAGDYGKYQQLGGTAAIPQGPEQGGMDAGSAPQTFDNAAALAGTMAATGRDEAQIAADNAQTMAAFGNMNAAAEGGYMNDLGGRMSWLSGAKRMADGGVAMGEPVIVGDPKSGAPTTPNIEMAAPVMEGGEMGMAVMPTDRMAQNAGSPAYDEGYRDQMQGMADPQRMKTDKEYLSGVMACEAEKVGGVPMAAEGGVFSNTAYSGQDIANMPSIRKLAGSMGSGFGGNMLDYSIPGSDVSIPSANRANITTLARMLPSELATVSGVVETPRAMGGLGLDFGDYLAGAQRSAPTGARFGAATYG